MKEIIKAILPEYVVTKIKELRNPFPGSQKYWEDRYSKGGNSGAGSYNNLAKFKAEVLNDFVRKNNVKTIIEFGCGDGNQLTLAEYPDYTGFDVSSTALEICKKLFFNDKKKHFLLLGDYTNQTAELTLSLDVIYHLVEYKIYEQHIRQLFSAAEKFVIIYAHDNDKRANFHEKTRKFTRFISDNISNWQLLEHIPNKYPYTGEDSENTSCSDFFIYERKL
ncbi:methyltransferase domain-containing protein [Pseudopedobacter sp.]|uniref:methyltransferase domain-containing protein n=1 Tax=Pseudopedobacter sp. TaxID=1936787 RepID=UPI0033401215